MLDIQEPQKPRLETGRAFGWLIGIVLLALIAYNSFAETISSFQDMWPQFEAMHYGFSPVPHGAILELMSIRRYVEGNAAILGVAVLWVWLTSRRRTRPSAMKLTRSDQARRHQAMLLLALPVVLIPNSLILLLQTDMQFRSGEIDYPAYGTFFISLGVCAFFFVLVSELIYGRRNTDTNDELRQHFRSKAIKSGYWAMLGTGVILYAMAIASPFWASMALPLMLLAGVVVPTFRFALLELFTGVG